MKVKVYSSQKYEIPYFNAANHDKHDLQFLKERLDINSVQKIENCDAVCCLVTDCLDREVLVQLKQNNVKLVALRSAGFDHVDLKAANELNIAVVRVPAYSPNAVAEFAVGMMLALSRKILRAHDKVRRHNFSLEGQVGFNIQGKTVGIIGTGHIGAAVAKILSGFSCKILAYDPIPDDTCRSSGVIYTTKELLLQSSDIISLHCPLNESTRYMINEISLSLVKPNVVLINTGRGALIDTKAIINVLKAGKIGALGLDVYEYERGLFFQDYSDGVILDDQFIRLQSFPNVLITGHQAFLTEEALENIAKTTLENISCFEESKIQNQLC